MVKWTKEKCHIEALKYNTRSDFWRFSQNAYDAANKYSWLDEICSHMIIKINQYDYDRIIYCYKFSDNSIYIGLTKNIKIRNWNRQKCKNDAVNLHIEKNKFNSKIIYFN